jgi:hypothetical protein
VACDPVVKFKIHRHIQHRLRRPQWEWMHPHLI